MPTTPRALSSFWRDVLGYVHPGPPGVDLPEGADPLAAWDDFLAEVGVPEEQRNTRSAIEDPDGRGPRLFFQQVPEEKVAKNRVHLDVRAAPELQGDERMAALEVECDRLVALGATWVRRYEPAPPGARRPVPSGPKFLLVEPSGEGRRRGIKEHDTGDIVRMLTDIGRNRETGDAVADQEHWPGEVGGAQRAVERGRRPAGGHHRAPVEWPTPG